MNITMIGHGPIALSAIELLKLNGHTIIEDTVRPETDCIVWCRGNNTDWCIDRLAKAFDEHRSIPFVVVTSEHGNVPTGDIRYIKYHALKAGQKMMCRCRVEAGQKVVDVSPAFVLDSGAEKRIHTDDRYREDVEMALNDEYPVLCEDVAKAIVFAVENCGKISGTEIKVSAGWTQGRL